MITTAIKIIVKALGTRWYRLLTFPCPFSLSIIIYLGNYLTDNGKRNMTAEKKNVYRLKSAGFEE